MIPYNGNEIVRDSATVFYAAAFVAQDKPVHRIDMLCRLSVLVEPPALALFDVEGTQVAVATPDNAFFSVTPGYYYLTATFNEPVALTTGQAYLAGICPKGSTLHLPLRDGGSVYAVDGGAISVDTANENLLFRVISMVGGSFATKQIDLINVEYFPLGGRKR